MRYIAHLDLNANQPSSEERFADLASDVAAPIRFYGPSFPDVESFIKGAEAMIMDTHTFLVHDGYRSLILERLREGIRLWIQYNSNLMEKMNDFLARFDVQGTREKVDDHLRQGHHLPVKREQKEFVDFAESPHLDGVEELEIGGARRLQVGGSSEPVLQLSSMSTPDEPYGFVVMAEYSSDEADVLVTSMPITHDPYHGVTGVHFAGIAHKGNRVLCRNMLEWLV